ncbi:RtcB family protein [Rhodococcus sp. 27YEA15]|uniref:RtcB family protein n=1 Tax=Rhodococcus sp. 27YEA15 TaxID=3156259 RepID=UPI003C7C6B3D
MPGARPGAGAAVGSVISTAGAITSAAVVVDIGCTMIALETQVGAGGLRPGRSSPRHRTVRAAECRCLQHDPHRHRADTHYRTRGDGR